MDLAPWMPLIINCCCSLKGQLRQAISDLHREVNGHLSKKVGASYLHSPTSTENQIDIIWHNVFLCLRLWHDVYRKQVWIDRSHSWVEMFVVCGKWLPCAIYFEHFTWWYWDICISLSFAWIFSWHPHSHESSLSQFINGLGPCNLSEFSNICSLNMHWFIFVSYNLCTESQERAMVT